MNSCTLCNTGFEFSTKLGHRALEHMGAHVLFDPSINREDEPCGLCLRPSSLCRIFLARGAGGKLKLNPLRSSGCGNWQAFRYSVAAKSTATSPCSNVPVACPICADKLSPAVWKYNLRSHIMSKHPSALLSRYSLLWELTRFETSQMTLFWRERLNIVVRRPGKSKEAAKIVISEAHTSTIALARSTTDAEVGGEDDEHVSDSEQSSDEDEIHDRELEVQFYIFLCFHIAN